MPDPALERARQRLAQQVGPDPALERARARMGQSTALSAARDEYRARNPDVMGDDPSWGAAAEEMALQRPTDYLARVKREDELTRAATAPQPVPQASFGEKIGHIGSQMLPAALDAGERLLGVAQSLPALAGGNFGDELNRRMAEIDEKGQMGDRLRGLQADITGIPQAVRPALAANERRIAESTESTVAGRFGAGLSRATGELAVLGPVAKTAGMVPTFAAAGAAHAEEGERGRGAITGGITGLLGPAAGRYAAEGFALARVIPARLRTAVAHGLGWTGVQGGVGELSGHPMTDEEALHAFGIGFVQTFAAKNPGATRLDMERAWNARVAEMADAGQRAMPFGVREQAQGLTPAPPTGLGAGRIPQATPALPEFARRPGQFQPTDVGPTGPAIPLHGPTPDAGPGNRPLLPERATLGAEGPAIPSPEVYARPTATGELHGPAIPLGLGRARNAEMIPRENLPRIADPLLPVRETIGEARAKREADTALYREGIGDIPPAPEALVKQVPKRLSGEMGAAGGVPLRGPLPETEMLRGLGREVTKGAQKTEDFFRRYLGEVTAVLLSHRGGDKMRSDILRAGDEKVMFDADVRAPLTEVREKSTRKAADWYQGRDMVTGEGGVEYAPNRLKDVREGRLKAPDAETAAVDAANEKYLSAAWVAKGKRGLPGPDGKPIDPTRPAPRRLPDADTPDLHKIIAENGDALKVVAAATADYTNRNQPGRKVTTDEVLRRFQKKREALASEGPGAADFKMASEFTHDLDIPGAVKIDGRIVKLQETNPRRYIDHFHAINASGVGMDMVFMDRATGKSTIQARRKAFVEGAENPRQAAKDLLAAMRAGHGLNPNEPTAEVSAPGYLRGAGRKIQGLGRAAAQAGISPIINLSESVVGNLADAAGVFIHNPKGGLEAVRDQLTRWFTGKHSPKVGELVREGLKTEDVPDRTRDIDNTKIGQFVEDLSRFLMRYGGPKTVEEGQETQAEIAGRSRMDAMMNKGKREPGSLQRESDIQDIRIVTGFSRDIVARFLDGKLTPEQVERVMRRYATRFAPVTVGANQTPAQKSKSQQHWLSRVIFKFAQYPATNIRYTAERLRLSAEAIRAKNVPKGEKAAARMIGLGKAGKHVALRATQGALSQVAAHAATAVIQAIFGGDNPLAERDKKEFSENPAKWLAENAGFAVLAGPFAGAARSLWGSASFEDIVYPIKQAKDLIKPSLKEGRGPGTDLMETVERFFPMVGLGRGRKSTLERQPRESQKGKSKGK